MSNEPKESSVLFSLTELMNLEEDRVRQESVDRQRHAEAQLKAQEDAQRRAREEQEALVRAEEERKHQEALRQREEAAHIEGVRAAEIERQRIEAERKAQLEAMAKQQDHARQLEIIRQDEGKKKLRNSLIGVAAFTFLAIGSGLGFYFGKVVPERVANENAAQKLAEEKVITEEKAKAIAEEASAKIKELQGLLDRTKDENTRRLIQEQIDNAGKPNIRHGGNGIGKAGPGSDQPPSTPKGASKGNCPPGDPLCAN